MAEEFEDLSLPQAVIGRIIKSALPESAAVAKDARRLISDCASVFALHLTDAANSLLGKRKTITGNDVLAGLELCSMDDFVPIVQQLLLQVKRQSKVGAAVPAAAAEAEADDIDLDAGADDDVVDNEEVEEVEEVEEEEEEVEEEVEMTESEPQQADTPSDTLLLSTTTQATPGRKSFVEALVEFHAPLSTQTPASLQLPESSSELTERLSDTDAAADAAAADVGDDGDQTVNNAVSLEADVIEFQ